MTPEARAAAVIGEHADCTLNDGPASAEHTGKDAWSCGIVLPYSESLDEAEHLHRAAALAAAGLLSDPATTAADGLRERVEALADEWEQAARKCGLSEAAAHRRHASDIRAALTATAQPGDTAIGDDDPQTRQHYATCDMPHCVEQRERLGIEPATAQPAGGEG